MTQDSDIAIIGGGLNGPALALALAQHGFSVTLIDARPAASRSDKGFDGRAYSLALGSQKFLQGIGIWPRIADKSQPILDIKASDGRSGQGPAPFYLHFDHRDLDEGPMGFMVEDRHLYQAFLDQLAETPNVTLRSGETVVEQRLTDRGMALHTAAGSRITAGLIVGCDGRNSATATRAGIQRQGWTYHQASLVCAIAHDKHHKGIAHQFFMPAGPLAILPLNGGHHSAIVWTESDAQAQAIQTLPDDAYLQALRPRFGDFLGEIRLAGDRFTYPLSLAIADTFVGPRLALVGDAAHGVHPIAGQGLNLGLRDGAALTEVLVTARRRGEDFAAIDVLQRYETWRRFETTTLALGMDLVNRVYATDNAVIRGARALGMAAINALPGVKRGFMRQAAGLSPSLPRMMRGEPL